MESLLIGLFYGLKNIAAQVFFWRLFYLNFSSNELSFGIILGNWFLTNFFGLLGGQYLIRKKFFSKIFPVVFLLDLAGFYLGVYVLGNGRLLFSLLPGQIFDLPEMIVLTFLTLFFLNFSSGLEFSFLISLSQQPENIYRGELLGFLSGGIVTTYFLFPTNQRNFLYLLYLLSLLLLILLTTKKLVGIGIVFSLLFSPVSVYQKIENKNIPGILQQLDTPYQNIKITSSKSQIVIYQNDRPALTLPAVITPDNELAVVLSRICQPEKNDWLVIGNYPALAAVTNQIAGLKPVWWEKDKIFLKTVRQYLDVTKFLPVSETLEKYLASGKKFSVILIYGLNPQTFASNYFFQRKFYLLLQKALSPEGILVVNLTGSETYLTPQLKKLNSCIFQTLKSVFREVMAIQQENTFLIASQKPLPAKNILMNNFPKDFSPKIITKNYLSYCLSETHRKNFEAEIQNAKTSLNTDFNPVAVFYFLSYLRKYSREKQFLGIISGSGFLIFAGLVFWYLQHKPKRNILLTVLTTGFSVFLFYWLVLALFQTKNSYLYQWLGLFSATFMLGNFLGTNLKFLTDKDKSGFLIDMVTGSFLLLGTIILLTTEHNNYISLALTLGSGIIIGWQFLWATTQTASEKKYITAIYTADIFGSFLAGFFTGILFFFPLHLGFIFAFLILVKLLNLVLVAS